MSQTITPAQGLPWTDSFLLGHARLDETHREFVAVVDRMLTCADADLAAAVSAFVVHAEAHFADEKAMMEATGFPATDSHVDDHNAVFASAQEVEALVLAGNIEIGRAFAAELAADEVADFLPFSHAEVAGGVEAAALLHGGVDHLVAERFRQLAQLGERGLELGVAHVGDLHRGGDGVPGFVGEVFLHSGLVWRGEGWGW